MKLICFLVFMSFSLLASSLEKVTDALPSDVKKLSLHKTSPKQAEKILGKADLIRGKKYYWEKDGFKYVLELVFDDHEKLSTLNYTFITKRPTINLDQKKLVPAGKYYQLNEKNMELLVDPVSQTIYSMKLL